jgi:hypothetical protein
MGNGWTRGVVGVPDGTTAEDQQNEDGNTPEVPSADDQIVGTVAVATAYESIAPMLGMVPGMLPSTMAQGMLPSALATALPDPQTGGGGAGGTFMFASVDELDGVIQQWQSLIDEIVDDQGRMADADGDLAEPAADQISSGNTLMSHKVVADMRKHNETLIRYAVEYVQKLQDARTQMVTMEEGNQQRMNQAHQ